MRTKRLRLLLGVGAAGLLGLSGAARANDLYFAMPINYDQGETDTVFVYGAAGITGSITSPNGFSAPFTVGANNVTSVVIPSSYDLTSSGVVTNNGFVVSTTNAADNVGASYLSREPYTTDTTYLFNSTALGTSYYALGYSGGYGVGSQLSIVGTQAGTTVTITPSTTLSSGQAAGVPFTVTLGAGQAVMYNGSDISGTQITSSAPIAVFGGNSCADVPGTSTACDHILTALPSTNNYTRDAIIPTTFGTESPSSNIVRVLAATDGTVVSYNGTPVATLNAGQYYEFRSGAGGELTASNPVEIAEYLTGQSEHSSVVGDPAESWIPGIDQWLNDYIFSTPVGSQAYETNFLDIAILTSGIGSLLLNGSAVPLSDCSTLVGTSYDTCEIAISPGEGEISAIDPFLLLIDGGTSYNSYFTFAGATFSPGASPPSTPTPEPASLALLGAGLASLFGLRRRNAA